MSITNENRKINAYHKKKLAELCARTQGELEERKGSGGKIVSKYSWNTPRGSYTFTLSWHNSVSDRHYGRTLYGIIRRHLKMVRNLFNDENIADYSIITSIIPSPGREYRVSPEKAIDLIQAELTEFNKVVNSNNILYVLKRRKILKTLSDNLDE